MKIFYLIVPGSLKDFRAYAFIYSGSGSNEQGSYVYGEYVGITKKERTKHFIKAMIPRSDFERHFKTGTKEIFVQKLFEAYA